MIQFSFYYMPLFALACGIVVGPFFSRCATLFVCVRARALFTILVAGYGTRTNLRRLRVTDPLRIQLNTFYFCGISIVPMAGCVQWHAIKCEEDWSNRRFFGSNFVRLIHWQTFLLLNSFNACTCASVHRARFCHNAGEVTRSQYDPQKSCV